MTRWHPREHRKALDGMLMLTLEERGAYNTCLDLIYDREGPIPDDGRWLSGWMGVSLRKWATIRASLVVKGKLFAVNLNGVDCLMNQRAAIELENQSERSRNLAEIGAKGGRKTAETRSNTSKNNNEPQASAAPTLKLVTSTETDTEEKNPNKPSGLSAPKPKRAKARFCPADWLPSEPDLAVGAEEGFSPGEIERELAKFRDYEFRDPHSDWSKTFRTWLRRAAERRPSPAHERPHPDAKFAARQANLATHERGADLAARLHGKP